MVNKEKTLILNSPEAIRDKNEKLYINDFPSLAPKNIVTSNTKLINRLTKLLKPIIDYLFPQSKKDIEIHKNISMNVIANILGLGNAATPLGIKAMRSMQEKNPNKEKLTDDMATFIILNTASIQVIPTTVIAIRLSLGSNDPTKIIFAVWFSTICAATVGIIITKICIKLKL